VSPCRLHVFSRDYCTSYYCNDPGSETEVDTKAARKRQEEEIKGRKERKLKNKWQ
jgi:hypothetical protein